MEIDGFYNLHLLMMQDDDLVYVITDSMRFEAEDQLTYACVYEDSSGASVRLTIPKFSVLTAVATI